MKKQITIMAILFISILLLIPCVSKADVAENELILVGDFKYKILSDTTVAVYSKCLEYVNGSGSGSSDKDGYKNSLTQLEIPSNVEINGKNYTVTTIGEFAFHSFSKLTTVTLPNTITTIEQKAFAYNSSLTNITIPNTVTSIGEWAFVDCINLVNINLPNKITEVKVSTFFNCEKLNNVTIPNLVTSIGENAFASCKSLTNVTIPNSVTNIGTYAFASSGLTNVTIPNNITTLESGVFANTKIENITIPSSVKYINDKAFYQCSSLKSVTIPKSVERIASTAFDNSNQVVITTTKGTVAESFAKNQVIPYVIVDDITEPEPPSNKKVGHVVIGGDENTTLTGNEIQTTSDVYAEMKAKLNEKGYKNVYCAYELTANGNIQNGVELTFDVGTSNNGKQVMILHKKADGTFEDFTRTVANGKVTITVTEFSPFMLAIKETTTGGSTGSSGGSSSSGSSNNGGNANNDTDNKDNDNNNNSNDNKQDIKNDKDTGNSNKKNDKLDDTPQTGDKINIAFIILIISSISTVVSIIIILKKKNAEA